jgi:dienelactone hydrolase
MAIREQLIEYRDGDALLEGFFCHDDSRPGPLPAVMINHAWRGRDEFVEHKARRLARHGFATFALDMYGKGKRDLSAEENRMLMRMFMQDRALLARRINAALAAVKSLPQVDPRRVAAMGYCFGGLCVLDLARSGADVRGVVSFHGLLKPTGLSQSPKISAKILIVHGYDDPFAPPEDVLAIGKELTEAHADWQLHAYGNTVHSFTDPTATDRAGGRAYDDTADRRSWQTLIAFLDEVLR